MYSFVSFLKEFTYLQCRWTRLEMISKESVLKSQTKRTSEEHHFLLLHPPIPMCAHCGDSEPNTMRQKDAANKTLAPTPLRVTARVPKLLISITSRFIVFILETIISTKVTTLSEKEKVLPVTNHLPQWCLFRVLGITDKKIRQKYLGSNIVLDVTD